MKSRIQVIDGFRAVAVLGVVWAHAWMFFGNPAAELFKINVAKLMSFFGTGVDLFFVISGFCMYLMFLNGNKQLTYIYYLRYVSKRWLRIAPAFYVAIFVYGLNAVAYDLGEFDWTYAAKQALFVRNFFSEKTPYAPHFWSLCTEWHFYLVLPIVMIGVKRFSFYPAICGSILACLAFRFFYWQNPDDPFSIISYSIPNRLVEFLAGLIAAKLFVERQHAWVFASSMGLTIGLITAVIGRVLMTSTFNHRDDLIGLMARVLDLPLLSMGFALIILNVLQHRTFVTRIMENAYMNRIGKLSYSMYLWHWIISVAIAYLVKTYSSIDPFLGVNVTFLLSVLALYPVSYVSYRLFEEFYFKKAKKVVAPVPVP